MDVNWLVASPDGEIRFETPEEAVFSALGVTAKAVVSQRSVPWVGNVYEVNDPLMVILHAVPVIPEASIAQGFGVSRDSIVPINMTVLLDEQHCARVYTHMILVALIDYRDCGGPRGLYMIGAPKLFQLWDTFRVSRVHGCFFYADLSEFVLLRQDAEEWKP